MIVSIPKQLEKLVFYFVLLITIIRMLLFRFNFRQTFSIKGDNLLAAALPNQSSSSTLPLAMVFLVQNGGSLPPSI